MLGNRKAQETGPSRRGAEAVAGPEIETGLPLVHSRVTTVRTKLGMSPFLLPTFCCHYLVSSVFIMNLPSIGNPLLPEQQV